MKELTASLMPFVILLAKDSGPRDSCGAGETTGILLCLFLATPGPLYYLPGMGGGKGLQC